MARFELHLESSVGHERGRVRAEQSHRHHDLIAFPGDLERLHEADAGARQVGLERDAPGACFLGDDGREAETLEIHGRTGPAEAEPRLRRITGAGEADRGPRCPIGLRAGGMARPPDHWAGAIEGEHQVELVGGQADRGRACLIGRDGAGDCAGEQQQAEERVPSRHQRKNRLISCCAARRPSRGNVGWATSR